MSDQEKSGGGSGASVVLVDKTASSRHKPYRPTELEEAAPDLHKRSRAPAVPSVAEELKDTTVSGTIHKAEKMENEHAVSSDKHTHATKKISSNKRRGSSPEEIAMVLMDAKKDPISKAPIPARVEAVVSEESKGVSKRDAGKKADDDSITEEMAELRTCDATKEHSEWRSCMHYDSVIMVHATAPKYWGLKNNNSKMSDDEEAGGLPRSDSRASRVSRAVRQLFCCGVAYDAPSEDDIPAREFSGI